MYLGYMSITCAAIRLYTPGIKKKLSHFLFLRYLWFLFIDFNNRLVRVTVFLVSSNCHG